MHHCAAADAYADAVSLWVAKAIVGAGSREELHALRVVAKEARDASVYARHELEAHTHDHGC
jgi:hypothetical protein